MMPQTLMHVHGGFLLNVGVPFGHEAGGSGKRDRQETSAQVRLRAWTDN